MTEVKIDLIYRDENWLIEQYWGFNLTMSEMGNIVDCPRQYIFNWMKKYNIPSRGDTHKQIFNDKSQRQCSCCQQFKDESEFYKQKNRNHGKTECKKCLHEKQREYNKKHGDEINKRAREYWQKNNLKDKYQDIRKKYRETHREQFKEYFKEHYQKHKDDWLQRSKNYRQTHPEKNKQRHKIYYEKVKHTEKFKIQMKKRRAKRKRNLRFIPLLINPFPEEIQVHYHHVNNLIVIPLPMETHFNSLGTNHREKCNEQIKNIYGLDLNNLLGGI